jgi:prevent-host-death family protein
MDGLRAAHPAVRRPPREKNHELLFLQIIRIMQNKLEIRIMRTSDAVTVSAAEFHRNIGTYQDMALTRPVAITKNGRERTVLLSAEEYHRLKRRDRRVIEAGELSERQVEAISNAKVPDRHAHLDDELGDWKA